MFSPSTLIDDEIFATSGSEIARQNRSAIRLFATAGIPIAIVNIIAQSFIKGAPSLTSNSVLLLVFFVALFLIERFVIPRTFSHITPLVYVLEAPVMLVTILQGTVWDPSHQAMTYLMFMVAMPAFILDRPIRVVGVTLCWNILFLALCATTKDPSTLRPDFLHCLEFYLLSIAVSYTVLTLRLDVAQSLESAKYNLYHDTLTGAFNRSALEARLAQYAGKTLVVLMGDIDRFTLIEDYYGNKIGHAVLSSFATILREEFGDAHTYCYGGDEFICIARKSSANTVLRQMENCQRRFGEVNIEGLHVTLTCSFGYVAGTPHVVDEVRSMVQLANIYAHKVKRDGTTSVLGGAFDSKALRDGIVDSNISSHARSYEVNQLTGLPSMPYFTMRGEEVLNGVADLERRPVVGYIKAANFRQYNDTFGYAQGDELIRTIARLLKEAFPKRHITYISGSRFGVLVYFDEIEDAMNHVIEGVAKEGVGRGVALIHAGYAEYCVGESIISLLDKARIAHDSITEQPEVTWRLYDQELDAQIGMHRYLVAHFDQALEEGWIRVHYQPIVDARTGMVCSLEALSRWVDPIYGLLSPDRFIGVLEEEKVLHKLSTHVVKQALCDLRTMRNKGLALVPISVNLSRNDFVERDMVAAISALVDASEFSRDQIKIEVTESAFMDNPSLLKQEVERFRADGFEVWMDDFGSEYSTLNSLEELTFDLIKLDMRFMQNFSEGSRSATIVSSVLDMCHRLHIVTLVEGVETPEQRASLRDMGCDRLQGYLFSPPRQLSDLISYFEAQRWVEDSSNA